MKAVIIGCPGSGKSTFARKLGEKTKTPLFYLDSINWNRDKTTVSRDVFDKRLSEILRLDEWIIDGNYERTMKRRLQACDTVFLFDIPTEICLDGARERIGKKCEDLPWIATEIDEEFLEFIKNFSSENLPKIYSILANFPDKKIIVFKSRNDADNFISQL